jgi:hypothetical protein
MQIGRSPDLSVTASRFAAIGLMSAERLLGKFDEVTGGCTSEAAVAVGRVRTAAQGPMLVCRAGRF